MAASRSQAVEPTLRLAADGDGGTIANLCAACGYHALDNVDWSRVYPYWLVAEIDGLILGAIQVAFSLPVGRIEFLAIEPELGIRDRAMLVRALAAQAQSTLRQGGCSLASFMIPDHLDSYRAILERRGAVVLFEGTTLIKAL